MQKGIKIRNLEPNDEAKVRSIHERCSDFPMPQLDHPLYIAKGIIERDGKVIGLGMIRLTSEAIVILDLDEPRSVRAKAIEEILRTGIYQCQSHGIDEVHTFLTGEITHSFADVLKRKYGFVDCEGIPLTLKL